MLSIGNFAVYTCCDRDISAPVNSLTRMCSDVLPWVDMAIGIILCILGAVLANYSIISTQTQTILYGVGGAQIIAGPLMRLARGWAHLTVATYNNARGHTAKENCTACCCFCCNKC